MDKYRVILNHDAETATVDIFDEIDDFWGEGLKSFSYKLSQVNAKKITVRIHSPGGLVTEGLAIRNVLLNHSADIETRGVGFVASIASAILLAGNSVSMDADSFLMIHDPAAFVAGGAEDLRNTADTLDTVKDTLAGIYVNQISKNGKLVNGSAVDTRAAVLAWMSAEKWFNSTEALDAGLIDTIYNERKQTLYNSAGALARFHNLPAELSNKKVMKKKETLLTAMSKYFGITEPEPVNESADTAEAVETVNETPETDTLAETIAELEAAGYIVTQSIDETEAAEPEIEAAAEAETVDAEQVEAAIEAKVNALVEAALKAKAEADINRKGKPTTAKRQASKPEKKTPSEPGSPRCQKYEALAALVLKNG